MKKVFFFLSIILSAFFILSSFIQGQECVPLHQSCDTNHICCDFPQNVCEGGYCVKRTAMCGELHTPCCDQPNPRCINSLVCREGYCEVPATPTPTSTPTPSCGMPLKNCCSTEPQCISPYQGSIMKCIMGSCLPETTSCGLLSKPCCENEPRCRVTNTECIEGYCRTPLPPHPNQPHPCDSNGDGTLDGIQTALGCIPTKDTTQFVAWILRFAIGIGGGIAFLLIIFGAIKVLTSAGNPEQAKAGQELITSALMGLLFIIFSLFLLQLIGVKILNIPGFGTP